MWHQFEGAFVRKVAYLAAALFFGFVFGHHAFSQTTQQCTTLQYHATTNNGNFSCTASSAAACAAQFDSMGQCGGSSATVTGDSGVAGGSWTGHWTQTDVPGCCSASEADFTGSITAVTGSCPQNCANQPNMDLLSALAQSSSSGGGAMCVGGCEYANGNNTLTIGSGSNRFTGQAVSTGAACGSSDVAASAGSCVSKGGTTTCVNDTPLQAVINGDTVSPGVSGASSNVPASGQCISFSSGGAMCTVPMATGTTADQNNLAAIPAMPTPPGPDNGTAGTPATPDAQVVAGGKAVNYYKPSTVASSFVGVTSAGVNSTSSSGVNSTGSGSGSGSTVVATSTCPAGQTCTGVTDATSGGQDCVNPPACTDADPVMCGIQNQEWLQRCMALGSNDIASAIGADPAVGNSTVDVSNILSESGNSSVNAVQSYDTTCPQPITVSIDGVSVTLDIFSKMCQFAGMLSVIIMAVAYMVAARVTFTASVANSF